MRLVDADKIMISKVKHGWGGTCYLEDIQKYLDDLPIVDAIPTVHAHWIKETKNIFVFTYINYKCSNCNQYASEYGNLFPYCPHRGAEMDEEIKDV